ncbi:DEAD/DEAH box helicase [Kordia zhangzhouensis]|uniref:DEAD/DEAH box helicase n=1 Tax=Kordia zhangzhouensis TaxID=1620405 RepID=UPI00062904CD|nr:DEAD/DEAH box helicase [Kordia zhangzhouensis]
MTKFEELGLQDSLLRAIQDMGFETPSEVQEKAIPILLSEETDIVALAQTGTGKTAAFGFPLIQKINADSRTTQGLILSPTRELCLQIANELKNYAKYENINVVAIYGGASITDQAKQVKKGAQIVVATPGRMQDMINRQMVDISKIEYCVLDEADEMLNMGFYEDITSILSHTPNDKSTWLFSATMPKEVATIAKEFMYNPKEITVGSRNSGSDSVQHEYYAVSGRDRYLALKRLADANPDIFSVVFCRTKRDTQSVAEKLIEDGYNAAALHGDLSQNQRDLVMKSFRTRQIQMLVATDVAARGIDVDDVTHVINYQLPDEIETYTHRSGRTGRAGKTGVSMVIITKSEMRKIKSIERKIQKKFEQKSIPTGMEICEIQLFHLANKIHNTESNNQVEDYLPKIMEIFEDTSKEELIKRMVSVEFNRFYNYYKNKRDLNQPKDSSEEQSSRRGSNEHSTRYFINVGSKDGYDWMRLKDFLKETLSLGRDDVYKVDVKESFSFFNTDTDKKSLVLAHFTDFKVDGRFVNVEESTNTGGSGGGKRRKDGGRKRRTKDRDTNNDNSRRRNRRSEPAEASNGRKKRRSEGGERFRGRSRRK